MFVSDRLIYLQLQKTGSTHIAKLLEQCVGGRQLKKHSRLPADPSGTGKTIIGSVRNPWDWYVSVWAFGCTGQGQVYRRVTRRSWGGHWRRCSREWRKPVTTWRNVYGNADDPALFRQWLRLILDETRAYDLGEPYGSSGLCSFAGFYTYRYLWLYSRDLGPLLDSASVCTAEQLRQYDAENNLLDAVIRNESLEDDLIHALSVAGCTLSVEQENRIRSSGRTNTSKHKNVGSYYDRETADLVARKEMFMIQKYRYAAPPNL